MTKRSDAKPAADAGGNARVERFTALRSEHGAVMDAYYDLWRNAKTDEERQKLAETTTAPDVGAFRTRAQALVDEDPTDQTAFDVLEWMLHELHDETTVALAVPLLAKHHFEREKMGDLLRALDSAGPDGNALVERLSEKSPHESVRGRALFSRAEHLVEDQRLAQELKDTPDGHEKDNLKQYLGDDRYQKLSMADAGTFEKPALELFKRVQKEYGTVKLNPGTEWESTLGERASASVFEIENLAVGKVTPDIAGEDIDGVAFRLSDYRGKVVMLDFWGFW
jgi:hypothetical protein